MGDLEDNLESLFLLEILVDTVQFDSPPKEEDLRETCVGFQFLNYPPIIICEEDFVYMADDEFDKQNVQFKSGKSLLFALPSLTTNDPNLGSIHVWVTRRVGRTEKTRVMGSTDINLSGSFENLLQASAKQKVTSPLSKFIKDSYTFQKDGEKVGKISAFLRISCFGKLILTQFQVKGDEKFRFKGLDSHKKVVDDSKNVHFSPGTNEQNPEQGLSQEGFNGAYGMMYPWQGGMGPGGMMMSPGMGLGGMAMNPCMGPSGMMMNPGMGPGGMAMNPGMGPGGMMMNPGMGLGGGVMNPSLGPRGMMMSPGMGPGGMAMNPGMGPGGGLMSPGMGPRGMAMNPGMGPSGMMMNPGMGMGGPYPAKLPGQGGLMGPGRMSWAAGPCPGPKPWLHGKRGTLPCGEPICPAGNCGHFPCSHASACNVGACVGTYGGLSNVPVGVGSDRDVQVTEEEIGVVTQGAQEKLSGAQPKAGKVGKGKGKGKK